MKRIVVDTNLLIDHLRGRSGLFKQLVKFSLQKEVSLVIPSIVLFELHAGWSITKAKEKKEVEKILSICELRTFDKALAETAGFIVREYKPRIHLADLIIGVTALVLNAKLATLNKKHFLGIPNLDFFDFKRLKELISPFNPLGIAT